VACPRRGGWIKVTMISRGVEISIAGGVAETEDDMQKSLHAKLYTK